MAKCFTIKTTIETIIVAENYKDITDNAIFNAVMEEMRNNDYTNISEIKLTNLLPSSFGKEDNISFITKSAHSILNIDKEDMTVGDAMKLNLGDLS